MSSVRVVSIDITMIRDNEYSGHELFINGKAVAYRIYDGSRDEDVVREVSEALGDLLRNQLATNKPRPWTRERPAYEEL